MLLDESKAMAGLRMAIRQRLRREGDKTSSYMIISAVLRMRENGIEWDASDIECFTKQINKGVSWDILLRILETGGQEQ